MAADSITLVAAEVSAVDTTRPRSRSPPPPALKRTCLPGPGEEERQLEAENALVVLEEGDGGDPPAADGRPRPRSQSPPPASSKRPRHGGPAGAPPLTPEDESLVLDVEAEEAEEDEVLTQDFDEDLTQDFGEDLTQDFAAAVEAEPPPPRLRRRTPARYSAPPSNAS